MNNGELQEVYRKRVLEHSREPHNFGTLEGSNRQATGFNPLCGDKVTVYLNVDASKISSISFDGNGCAISIASASMMTDVLRNLSVTTAARLIRQFKDMFDSGAPLDDDRMKELSALEGVKNYPSRIKCATLAWSALEAALNNDDDEVCTE